MSVEHGANASYRYGCTGATPRQFSHAPSGRTEWRPSNRRVIPTFNNDGHPCPGASGGGQYCGRTHFMWLMIFHRSNAAFWPDCRFSCAHNPPPETGASRLAHRLLVLPRGRVQYALTIDSDGQSYSPRIFPCLWRSRALPGTFVVSANLASENMPSGYFCQQVLYFWFWLKQVPSGGYPVGIRLYPLSALGSLRCLRLALVFEVQILCFCRLEGIP